MAPEIISLRKTPSPTALRERVVSYALWAYKVLIERVVVYALEGTNWIGNNNF